MAVYDQENKNHKNGVLWDYSGHLSMTKMNKNHKTPWCLYCGITQVSVYDQDE